MSSPIPSVVVVVVAAGPSTLLGAIGAVGVRVIVSPAGDRPPRRRVGVVVGGDAGDPGAAQCAVVDVGAAAAFRRRVAVLMPATLVGAVEHPSWCVPQRCDFVVPPVMVEMPRRHRGQAYRFCGLVTRGSVIVSLVGGDDEPPVVAVFVSSRGVAKGWAELPLGDAAGLAERLTALVRVANHNGGDGGR